MTSAQPLLSVFIPAYNGEKFVRAAVESALDNGIKDLEVVVVDDGSADGTARVVESIRHPALLLHRNPANIGVAATRRQSLPLLHGRYVALLDADDIALPGRFARQLERLESAGGPDIVGGAIECFGDATGIVTYPATDAQICASLLFNPSLANPAVTMKLAPLREGLIGYTTGIDAAEDYTLWVDAMLAGLRFENLAAPVTRYRRHPDSLTALLPFERIGAQNMRVRLRVAAAYFPALSAAERDALVDAISRNITAGQRWLDCVCALAHAAALVPDAPRIDAGTMLGMLEEILMRLITRALAQAGISYETLEMLSDTQAHFERWRAADNGALDTRIMALFKS